MAMSETSPAPPYVANKDNTHQGECESDETETNEDYQYQLDIDPADLEDGEILDDEDDSESKPRLKIDFIATTDEGMVNLNKIMMNNPIGNDNPNKRKKKKQPPRNKRVAMTDDPVPNKRKKYMDHADETEPFERNGSPIARTRDASKRHRDTSFGPSRRPDKGGSFEEEIALEERRHQKQGTKLPVHQRLGDRNSNRAKGRGSRSLGAAGKRGGLNSRAPLRKPREQRPKPVCKFYMDGNCNKGAVCPFSHDTTPYKKRDLCKFYLNGYCAKEDVCLFMHEDFPCKFFHTGAVCYADTECRFSHEPLNDETEQLLARYLDSCHNYPKPERRRDRSPPRMDRSPPRMDRGDWIPPHHEYPPHHHNNNNNQNNNNRNDGMMNMNNMNDGMMNMNNMNEGMMNMNNMNDGMMNMNNGMMNMNNNNNFNQRPSLLGSPPRHIKEAAPEWQLDLMMNMQENGPPCMGRPNFYMDTLAESPQHGPHGLPRGQLLPHGPHMMREMMERRDMMEPFQMGGPFPQPPCGDLTPTQGGATPIPTDDEAECDADEKAAKFPLQITRFFPTVNKIPDPEEKICAAISAIRAETDFNRTPPHLEVERSLSPTSRSENEQPPDLLAGSPADSPVPAAVPLPVIKEEVAGEDSSKEEMPDKLEEPAEEGKTQVFPSHLPRKQRELFMRIQQHERLAKLKAILGKGDPENPDDPTGEISEEDTLEVVKEEVKPADIEKPAPKVEEKPMEIEPKKEEEEDEEEEEEDLEEEPKAKWYSSDEDDDENGDQPLTDVLKRLQQMPPPVARPPSVNPDVKAGPAIDIAKMLSSIREQATQQSGGLNAGMKSDFWQNILSATAPPPSLPEGDTKQPQPKRDPRCRSASSKMPPPPSATTHGAVRKPVSARDPRLSRSAAKPDTDVTPPPAPKPKAPEAPPPAKEDKTWEMGGKDKKGSHSYRLHTVTVSPLNYSSYLFATQNDNRLLEDPRLKKLLTNQTSPRPATTLPFPPELQLYLEQGDVKAKQQSPPAPIPPTPVSPQISNRTVNLILGAGTSAPVVQKIDPRLKRNPPPSAQSPVHTPGGMTPPHPMMDLPPNLHSGGFTPPHLVNAPQHLINSPHLMNHPMMDIPNPLMMGFQPPPHINPMMDMSHPHLPLNPMIPHSHMPRGFIDPRFTRMQQPMMRGRGRGPPPRHQPPIAKIHKSNKSIAKVIPEIKNTEPVKVDANEKKSLRKTQMDYASPLSAYDEGETSEGYNRRPQPKPRTISSPPSAVTVATPVVSVQPVIPSASVLDSVPEVEPSADVNAASLREVFKTIDPTASPFC